MIYRIRPSEKKHEKRERKPYRRAGVDSVRRLYGYRGDAIDMEALFELAKLEGRVKARRRPDFFGISLRIKRAAERISVSAKRIALGAEKFCRAVYKAARRMLLAARRLAEVAAEKRRAKKRAPSNIYILAGAACGVLLVGAVSGCAVFYRLLLRDHFGSFQRVTVPDTVGLSYDDVREYFARADDLYDVTVEFEYSRSVPYGTVMSQTPSGGAERKIYSDGSLCAMNIVVSLGKETAIMKDYSNASARDAELELRNGAYSVVVIEDFSDTVESGKVISTSPKANELIEVGGLAVLYVSAGKKTEELRVPDVCGLNENAAAERIVSAGFSVGRVSYAASSKKAGTVIAQDVEPKSTLERGGEISLIVSAGQAFENKTMPSLYGLTLTEAREKLAQYGLVCGNVYAVDSKERHGTVIAQSLPAGSVLSGTSVSVDLYVSS